MAIPDPVNPRIKLRARTSASMVEVKDDSPAFWEARDVPHGAVEINWEKSKAIAGETRAIWIYTPPDYAQDDAPLSGAVPAARLERHGGRLDHGGQRQLRAGQSAGRRRRRVPMIVVMPFGHATPFGVPGAAGRSDATMRCSRSTC